MSQDYLWDRSGSDPEIESLENALAVFRYQESAVPVVTPAIVATPRPLWPGIFSVRVAFGLATAAVLIFGVVWLGSQRMTPSQTDPSAAVRNRQNSMPETVQVQGQLPAVEQAKLVEVSAPRKTIIRAQFVRRQRTVPQKAQTAQNAKAAGTELAAFTQEERDAYQRLMLALAITGSKLKLVQDTIDRIEDTNTSNKQR